MIIDREERRRRKRRQIVIARTIFTLVVITVAAIVVIGVNYFLKNVVDSKPPVVEVDSETETVVANHYVVGTEAVIVDTEEEDEVDTGFVQVGDVQFVSGYTAHETDATINSTTEEIESEFFILIDESTGEIVAQRKGREKFYPASMTKILSILVAAEHIESEDQLEDQVTVTSASTNFSYANGLSAVGYLVDEVTTVRELFYGTILPSGGDAVHALALYTAGSHEAFVDMMNEKVAELGLAETSHFTNCAGLYDDENYSTPYDIAMILKAAEENEICREILKTRRYTIPESELHPDGIYLSNMFLRRIEDHYEDGEFLGAKTGFVNQSRNCCASYMLKNNGTPYICVTGKAPGSWPCIYDHIDIYTMYTK